MMGITEVNPLSAHYRCDKCKMSIFEDEEGNSFGATYSSGYDLPDKECPNCHTKMIKDGQDMPFATFLGFNADKQVLMIIQKYYLEKIMSIVLEQ